MVDKIDKFREKFVELLNETDPYERVDKMSSYANDVLTFYLSLGPMFRNGTLGTYACPKLPDWQECDIYVFPNGSTPIKKSTIGLLQRLDSSLAAAYERAKLNAATWLPEYRSNDSLDITYMHIQLSLVLDSLIGSNCKHPLVYIKFEEQMRNITKRGHYNGGDSNKHVRAERSALIEMFRCLQNFVIRHNNYSEDAYKAFVGHMGTMAFNELNTFGLCLGVSTLKVNERDDKLKKFAEQFHGISKQLLDARLVLKEEPPTPETTMVTTERAATEPPTSEPTTFSITDQIEKHRVQAIKLLNDTDAYEMATMIADSVEDTLKFFDVLGPFFRNGTLATYMCMLAHVSHF
ncbi:hypothetical protein AAVH_22085 [Aphelenchoides avenae]|nr:hypothetical protein AAVH_22085 [Aphelenchus avenae]